MHFSGVPSIGSPGPTLDPGCGTVGNNCSTMIDFDDFGGQSERAEWPLPNVRKWFYQSGIPGPMTGGFVHLFAVSAGFSDLPSNLAGSILRARCLSPLLVQTMDLG